MATVPNPITDDFLDGKRTLGDPAADRVVEALIEAGTIDEIDRDLLKLLRNDQTLPPGLPSVVTDYFDDTGRPLDVDPAHLRTAQTIFARYGPEILTVLGFGSLPAAYAAHKGVQVLYRTGFLGKRPMRRVLETSRMVAEVMAPDGLAADGGGIRVIQKVRLMHAGIRRMLLDDHERPWDTDDLGVPINQEDLAGTLMTFSFVVLLGLRQLHAGLTEQQELAYLLTWSAIGKRMGLDDDLNPQTLDEARRLTIAIRGRQFQGSPEGIAMTKALVAGYAEWLDRGPKGIPEAFIHFLLDDDVLMHKNVAAELQVPKAGWFRLLPLLFSDLIRAFGFLVRRGPVQAGMGRWLSRHVVAAMLHNASSEGATFSIPDRVRDDWNLPVKGARV